MFSVPGAKEALKEMLAARPALEGVLVKRGFPTKTAPRQPDRIYVVGSKGITRDPGPGQREEVFSVSIIVECFKRTGANDDGSAITEARMWALADEIDLAVIEDRELGIAVWGADLELEEEITGPTTDGWIARGHFKLTCSTFVPQT